jgi:hypothetical protein
VKRAGENTGIESNAVRGQHLAIRDDERDVGACRGACTDFHACSCHSDFADHPPSSAKVAVAARLHVGVGAGAVARSNHVSMCMRRQLGGGGCETAARTCSCESKCM